MAVKQLMHRISRTLVNRDYADKTLGLRGTGLLIIALTIIANGTWGDGTANNWLIVIITPLLFAIGAFLVQAAWRRSKPRPDDD